MCILILYVFLISISSGIDAQVITTIAGTGEGGYNGHNIMAIEAQLSEPSGLWIDNNELFFTDLNNNRIRLIDTAGIITTIAGNGEAGYNSDHIPAMVTELNKPNGICLDEAGNIYVADWYNNRVRMIDNTTELITTVAGSGAYGFNADGIPAIISKLAYPADVITDNEGNIYFADHDNNRIREVVKISGVIITVAGNGTFSYTGDGGLAKHAALAQPTGICFDPEGNLIIVDHGNAVIRRVNNSGIIMTIAGNGITGFSGDDGPALSASFDHPTSACYDQDGNLFIADQGNNRIRKIDHITGIITTVAGTGTASYSGDGGDPVHAGLNAPWDIVFNTSGNLYITDLGNNRIRKIDFEGTAEIQDNTNKTVVQIHPNPATDIIFIGLPSFVFPGEVIIRDITGRLIERQNVNDPLTPVNIRYAGRGLNLISFISVEGIDYQSTFLKIL